MSEPVTRFRHPRDMVGSRPCRYCSAPAGQECKQPPPVVYPRPPRDTLPLAARGGREPFHGKPRRPEAEPSPAPTRGAL